MTRDEPLDFSSVRIDPVQVGRIPRALAFRRTLLPLAEIDGALHVACLFPPDEMTRQALLRQTGAAELVFHTAEAVALRRELLRAYGGGAGERLPGKSPVAEDAVALADELFRAARLRRASDIHIDPGRERVAVRFRVDGVLEPYRELPNDQLAPLVSRIKVMAGMDIAERRAPPDGAVSQPSPMTPKRRRMSGSPLFPSAMASV